jgi:hypothetical protein
MDPALSRAELKQLQPLGHHLSLWAEAAQRLLDHLEAGRLPPTLSSWLQAWHPSTVPTTIQPGEKLSLTIQQTPQGWQLAPEQTHWFGDAWWRAWLHLPALRSFWASALRSNHLTALRSLIPVTWCMDPQPLPPGTTLPHLSLATWADLARLPSQGRSFQLQTREQTSLLHGDRSEQEIQQAISEALKQPGTVLTETFSPLRQLKLTFSNQEQKISLDSALL